ncbi:ABC transporter ATP-binding protein [Desulfosporosinus metallidurans]|uniref:Oligopeptide transport system permease protein OppB n=1 Tax=Desulfosporosinus metallidurans TaxID=1888891 RepID=A0A1Q8R2H5_9FIRM|nr:ABC transporter ATP-binding protein [Desulfosporosinus metallidurans]OLN33701.1 Oligopeptide transport system permease protein OppB [Desulfosporosinus metallidurans]
MGQELLLQVKDLRTHFYTEAGVVKAVDGVDLEINKGETLGVVGESGSGKSITAMSIMRLIPVPPGKIVSGEVMFSGKDLIKATESEMMKIRGNEIAMIFQDPMTSLNPVLTVGEQIMEAIILHQKTGRSEAKKRAVEMLKKVGIPEAESRVNNYPHQFSGGMRQRVMIAMALSCNPKLLIADEPTTALDVTIQAQILDLMNNLKKDFGTAIMLITHDLGVVAELCQKVLVMYAGNTVEYTNAEALFAAPKHPYTWGLLGSLPKLDESEKQRLEPIEGQPPDLRRLPQGCNFAPRCKHKKPICEQQKPTLQEIEQGHFVSCFLYGEGGKRHD